VTTWSLSTFNNELDILEIRLAELDDVVDIFVIGESRLTQTGQTKPLVFLENVERFERWMPKIRYLDIDLDACHGDWAREYMQRDMLGRGLDGLEDDDLILLSDVDEIPRASLVADILNGRHPLPMSVHFPIHVYRLDWRWPEAETGFCRCRFFHGYELTWDAHRGIWSGCGVITDSEAAWARPSLINNIVGEYGWHFSYQGDARQIQTKIGNMADNWVRSNPGWADLDWINESIDTGRDVFDRDFRQAEPVPLEWLPEYVQQNADRFSHLMRPVGSRS